MIRCCNSGCGAAALRRQGIKIVTNMGAANPEAAAKKTAEIVRSLGLSSLKLAAIVGDDVLKRARPAIC